MKRIWIYGTLLFLILGIGSCDENDPTQPDVAVVEALLTHFGFDFSAGTADTVDYNNNDGETIAWMPGGGTNPSYPGFGSHIWFRTSSNTSMKRDQCAHTVDGSRIR